MAAECCAEMGANVTCGKPARCGITSTRPTRGNIKSTMFYDEREAPKTASLYCKEHGIEVISALARVLIDNG